MKKFVAFVLAAVLLMAVSVTGFAASVSSPAPNPPEVIVKNCDDCKIVTWSNRDVLAPEKKDVFEAAKELLKDVVPEGFACRDYVYQDVNDDCEACDIGMLMCGTEAVDEEAEVEWLRDEAEEVCSAYRVSLSLDGVSEVAVKQYVGEEWVEKEVTVEDDFVVILEVVDGPIAIFMK